MSTFCFKKSLFKEVWISQTLIFIFKNTQLLGSLPGVNPDDPAIQAALRKANDESDKKDESKDK